MTFFVRLHLLLVAAVRGLIRAHKPEPPIDYETWSDRQW